MAIAKRAVEQRMRISCITMCFGIKHRQDKKKLLANRQVIRKATFFKGELIIPEVIVINQCLNGIILQPNFLHGHRFQIGHRYATYCPNAGGNDEGKNR